MSHTFEMFDAPRDLDVVARMVALSFSGTPDKTKEWLASGGHENLRVVREGGRAVSSLLQIPMGAYFGGRSVPLLGVAGVAVAPESRGRGLAEFLMRSFIRSAHEQGWALAGLYASTHTLYRKIGYEHAGHRFQYTVPFVRIDAARAREDGWTVVALGESDEADVRACYAAFARRFEGALDRGPYIWSRLRKLREDVYTGFGIRDASGTLRAYVFLTQQRSGTTGRHDVILSDLVFLDADAGRRLWNLLRDFQTMGESVVFYGGPTHPALQLLNQQRHEVKLKDDWLIRVVDARKALEARGYSPAVRAELQLEIEDELVPANAGRFVLRVAEGRGSLHPGGKGSIRVSARGLATLYSGFNSPTQARMLGLVDGPEAELERADSVFARSTPWMSDMY